MMKNMILLLGLLLCLCASSWGACRSVYTQAGQESVYRCDCPGTTTNCPLSQVVLSGKIYLNPVPELNSTCYSGRNFCGGKCGWCQLQNCYFTLVCDTQAEADSVVISQKCTTGTMAKDTANGNVFDVCKNGEGLLFAFNNPITGVHNSTIGYYIVTDDSADSLDEATYNHLAAQACTEVALYRGVLNGKYVYWYSTDPEPAGVANVVRIK